MRSLFLRYGFLMAVSMSLPLMAEENAKTETTMSQLDKQMHGIEEAVTLTDTLARQISNEKNNAKAKALRGQFNDVLIKAAEMFKDIDDKFKTNTKYLSNDQLERLTGYFVKLYNNPQNVGGQDLFAKAKNILMGYKKNSAITKNKAYIDTIDEANSTDSDDGKDTPRGGGSGGGTVTGDLHSQILNKTSNFV